MKDIFLLKAKNVHGNKYDYSLVDYKNNKTKVKIVCPEHGCFEQTPYHHIKGKIGCKRCADGKKRFNSVIFINNAMKVHGNKYDYSLVEYTGSNNKVKIICEKHGVFEQSPICHVNGKRGCDKCGGTSTSTTEEFILRSIKIHGDKYNYSDVKYISGRKKIKILCREHGEFGQTPESHLAKNGCPICGGNLKLTKKEFVDRSNLIHINKYDYELSDIDNKNSREKVKIDCPKHGVFEQVIFSHLSGHGCPHCKISKGEMKISNILKELNIKHVTQKAFDGCRYKRKLKFDFYLPEHNLCVEYDGGQHFKTVKRWSHDDKKLEDLKIRDEIKNQFCHNNNINLLRIKYNENIEEILKNNINTCQVHHFLSV